MQSFEELDKVDWKMFHMNCDERMVFKRIYYEVHTHSNTYLTYFYILQGTLNKTAVTVSTGVNGL